jgi:hypothetical protein
MEFMMFTKQIKQLREERQIPQRKLAALDIPIIAEILQADPEELLTLWLVDKIITAISNKKRR